jgi:uncharacterized protein YcaQ
MAMLDQPSLETRVVFVAPLDPFMWDRKMIAQLFGFDYTWEIYTPLAKRKWGYYVLPVLHGDRLVARVEFACRKGVLEMIEWHEEAEGPDASFWGLFEAAIRRMTRYCGATELVVRDKIPGRVREHFLNSTGA